MTIAGSSLLLAFATGLALGAVVAWSIGRARAAAALGRAEEWRPRARARDTGERRQRDLGQVGQQLRDVAVTHQALRAETNKLVQALRAPNVRGRWGEIALRRVAELAGMSTFCDFIEQETVQGETNRLR